MFELRTYYAAPGKLDALLARFRDHTCKLFEKHGMANVGYWVPQDNPDSKLVYILRHASPEARIASWTAFGNDPQWQAVVRESEKSGKLTLKIESTLMDATGFSPIR
jgi:hypothetical protein